MGKRIIAGAVKSPIDIRDHKFVSDYILDKLPVKYILPKLPNIHDQGDVGSCVAHSLSFMMEKYNNVDHISNGFIYGNRRHTTHLDSGLVVRDALKTIHKDGAPAISIKPLDDMEVPNVISEFDAVYDEYMDMAAKNTIEGYVRINNIDDAKKFIYECNSYVLMIIKWHDDYEIHNDGEIIFNTNSQYGHHAVVMCGWDDYGPIFANSWGKEWSNDGIGKIGYGQDDLVVELWGVYDSNHVPVKTIRTHFVLDTISKIINMIVNFIVKNR